MQLYTDPKTSGAPQVGDIVVVGPSPRHDLGGQVGTLVHAACTAGIPWQVLLCDGYRPWVSRVRRPTEAELATWALGQR